MYFDWTATSPVSEKALDEYCRVSRQITGNPSSTHPMGLAAKEELTRLRTKTAELLDADVKNIFFTSGGTESDAIVLSSLLTSPSAGEIITTGIEHSAVIEFRSILESKGWVFTTLRCPQGYLDINTLKAALNEKVRMVCVMAVNNVTGTVQDIKGVVDTVREFEKSTGRKIHIHCDAVQALGKIHFSCRALDFDSAAFSAHKICGPRGIGILYNRNKAVCALSKGGGQEKGLRPGTENLPAIAAMTVAMEEAINNLDNNGKKVLEYRKTVEKAAVEAGYSLLSPSCNSSDSFSPYILSICVKPLPSEVFLRIMSDKGFCLSAGSACSTNNRGKAESVLNMMNIKPEDRMSAIRISFGPSNTQEEVQALAGELINNGKH